MQEDEDFAALFEASYKTRRIETGQTVEGVIVAIGAESVLVDVGAKGEATLALSELKNSDGVLEAAVGDKIHATVVSTTGGITLSRKLQRGAASARQIEDAFRAGLPVEGKIEKAVKAGYDVRIAGQRAFCPQSQIDTIRDSDPATHVGRVYTFRIIEYRDNGQKFVVSRRALLEEEQQARAAEVRQSIAVGAVIAGRVVSVRDFGAFIDLGSGVQGLLHVSEMGWSRVTDPSNLLKPGEEISVKVLKLDEDKISLGLKQLSDDPWAGAAEAFAAGREIRGTVERHEKFGVFVTLAPGIVGLLPSNETGLAKGADLKRAFPVGSDVQVVVLDVDATARRIRLSVKAIADAAEASEVRDYAAREDAAEKQSFGGSLADKLRGALKKDQAR
ncbi:MAG: S1 RNA-binding domain-containing protein [Acidobacteria bacterium]|nr:MAG: S1 RNA-binding domain-containing protein [Acidobacteriota bacterium]